MGGVVSESQPVAMPQTAAQAAVALRQLSSDYFAQSGNATAQQYIHAEAQAIRSRFPGSGPAGGYTQAQLSSPQSYQAPVQSVSQSAAGAPATSSTRTIPGLQGYYSQSTYVAGRGWVYSGWVSTAAQVFATHQAAAYATPASTAVSATLPVAMPQSAAAAAIALRQLSSDYFAASGSPQAQAAAHAEAQSIRQRFPGTGPAAGYTAAQLVASPKAAAKPASIGFIGSVASGVMENATRFLGGGGSAESAAAAIPYAQAGAAAAAEATGIVAGAGLAAYGLGRIPAVQHAGAAASSAVNRLAGALTGSGSGAQASDHGIPAGVTSAGIPVGPITATAARTAGNILAQPGAAGAAGGAVATSLAGQAARPAGYSPAYHPTATAATLQAQQQSGSGTTVAQAKKQQGGGGFLGGLGSSVGRVVGTGAAIGGGAALLGGTPQGQSIIASVGKDVGQAVGSAAKGIGQGASGWPWWLWLLIVGGAVVAGHELG